MSHHPDHHHHNHAITKVTLIGALLDLVLGILKILVGLLSNSVALISDGVHSLSDLLTDAFVLVVARFSRKQADAGHPYGHGRFETVGTVFLAMVLFSVAAIICYESLLRLWHGDTPATPGVLAMVVALASIAGKEWIYRYTKKVADEVKSSILLANAWHSRSDALSSIAVVIGIAGAWLGHAWMDLAAAIFVALIIGHIAWELVRDNLNELVDAALPEQEVEAIRRRLESLPGVQDIHNLRTRRHAGKILVDLHMRVSPRISVSEGHYLGERLTAILKQDNPDISDVVVHVDPEVDAIPLNLDLPLRGEVRRILLQRWSPWLGEDDLERLTLHYVNDQIEVEAKIKKSFKTSEMEANLNDSLKDIPWLSTLHFL